MTQEWKNDLREEAMAMARRKVVTFLRHGQALHNPRAEAARHATPPCSFEEFLRLMKEDDAFDAALTDIGTTQAADLYSERIKCPKLDLPPVNLVVTSPLSRAIDTAAAVFPEETKRGPFLCLENLRERNGLLLNAKRMKKTELMAKYPLVDFSNVPTEDDVLWKEEVLEDALDSANRGYRCLRYLWERPEVHIVVAAHGGIFNNILNDHPAIKADERMRRRFQNCEMRTCEMTIVEPEKDDHLLQSTIILRAIG